MRREYIQTSSNYIRTYLKLQKGINERPIPFLINLSYYYIAGKIMIYIKTSIGQQQPKIRFYPNSLRAKRKQLTILNILVSLE